MGKQIMIADKQAERLEQLAADSGDTESALVEQALELLFRSTQTEQDRADWELLCQLEAEIPPVPHRRTSALDPDALTLALLEEFAHAQQVIDGVDFETQRQNFPYAERPYEQEAKQTATELLNADTAEYAVYIVREEPPPPRLLPDLPTVSRPADCRLLCCLNGEGYDDWIDSDFSHTTAILPQQHSCPSSKSHPSPFRQFPVLAHTQHKSVCPTHDLGRRF